MKSIKKEKSCGAVVFKIQDQDIYFLLIKHIMGHWSFPKGHVNNNEKEVDTALREIKEEVNLNVKIDENFREVSTYSPYASVIKDVVFFVGEAINDEIVLQNEEILESTWKNIDDAKNIITYQSDIDILTKAYNYIRKKY